VDPEILNHIQRIPTTGERFELEGLEIRVEKATRNRIQKVSVSAIETIE